MAALQAIGIAILQGATELFPISSFGRAVVVPPGFGPFEVEITGLLLWHCRGGPCEAAARFGFGGG